MTHQLKNPEKTKTPKRANTTLKIRGPCVYLFFFHFITKIALNLDVAVEVLNNTVPQGKQLLDRKYAHSVAR